MNINNTDVIMCDCCNKELKTAVFVPSESKFRKNFIFNEGGCVCFECLGFYLNETYLKNAGPDKTISLIKDIESIKKDLKKSINEEPNTEEDLNSQNDLSRHLLG